MSLDDLPIESSLIIQEILKKNGLNDVQEEGLVEIFNSPDPDKKKGVVDNLPGTKIAQLVRGIFIGETRPEEMPQILEKDLNVSSEKAKKIAEDLNEKFSLNTSDENLLKNSTNFPPKKDLPRQNDKDNYKELIE